MKRSGLLYIYIILASAFTLLLTECRTTGKARKSGPETTDTHIETVKKLSNVDNASELTARLSFSLSGRKATGQLRMRRDHSIQIGISVLGLVEVVRIEFLPDKVIVMDRTSNRYALCHYADLPLRNELGLDFNVVQALLWNRLFSPGAANEMEILRNVVYSGINEQDDLSVFKDKGYEYLFRVNNNRNLVSTSKTVSGKGLSVGYSDFKTVSDGLIFPMTLNLEIVDGANIIPVIITLSSVSTSNGSWPDETGVGRRMTRVSLEELTQGLSI